MARPKKIKEEIEVVATHSIAPLTVDFGRADLNELRDKLNEVIARI